MTHDTFRAKKGGEGLGRSVHCPTIPRRRANLNRISKTKKREAQHSYIRTMDDTRQPPDSDVVMSDATSSKKRKMETGSEESAKSAAAPSSSPIATTNRDSSNAPSPGMDSPIPGGQTSTKRLKPSPPQEANSVSASPGGATEELAAEKAVAKDSSEKEGDGKTSENVESISAGQANNEKRKSRSC